MTPHPNLISAILMLGLSVSALAGCQTGDSSKRSDSAADDGDAKEPVLDKKINKMTADDLTEAFEALGYGPAAVAKSGEITTVSGMSGKSRLIVTHYKYDDEDRAGRKVEVSKKHDKAGKSEGGSAIVVATEPVDQDKAEDLLARIAP